MRTIRLPIIGEITIDISTLYYSDGLSIINGFDDNHNNCTVRMSKVSWNEDFTYEYGWCRVLDYIINGKIIPCNHVSSIE